MPKSIKLESPEFMVKYGIDIRRRTLIVGISYLDQNTEGEVGFIMQSNFSTALHLLVHEYVPQKNGERAEDTPITIVLSSYGGDLYQSLNIYDQISLCPVPTHIHAFGPIMSGGSIIMQAAVRRFMSPNAFMMIHYGWHEEAGENDPWKSREANRHNQQLLRTIENIYLSRVALSQRRLRDRLRMTYYMDAHETVRDGFADKVLEVRPIGVPVEEAA